MSSDNPDVPTFNVEAINRAVYTQDFTWLQHQIVDTSHVGHDIVILLAMITMLHTQVKFLREELSSLRVTKDTQ